MDELDAVYRAHVASIYGFFSYSVGRDHAEDLTAATFERVVRSWGRYDASRSGERTWIYAIARNLLTDHLRRQRHRSGPSLDEHPALLEGVASSDDPAELTLEADAVSAWLRQLRPRAREVLALRFCADCSVAEIARIMDLTESNVHQICSRALRHLRSTVADERPDQRRLEGPHELRSRQRPRPAQERLQLDPQRLHDPAYGRRGEFLTRSAAVER
ncbi:MAG TPA: sigma-70 family RNA polymerase sigma factor [Solirubrobacteraceae bacterium]|nr:sigma-70 family RNA polymerase sigma factor [Solirubrobacteraceae bacterium]